MRADFNDGLDALDNGAKPARGSSSSRLSTRRCRTGDISRTRCDVESAKEIGSTEPRWAEVDPQQLVVTERLQWPLAKYNGRSFSDSADGLSAVAAIGTGRVLRRQYGGQLTMAASSNSTAASRISELTFSTRSGLCVRPNPTGRSRRGSGRFMLCVCNQEITKSRLHKSSTKRKQMMAAASWSSAV